MIKIFNLTKTIYLNYAINLFSINILIILLYIFNLQRLVNETAILSSFAIVLCQIFSGNSRSLVLATKNYIKADSVITLRLILIFPITIFCLFFLYQYNFSDYSFATSVFCLIISQWVYEIFLSKEELISKKIIFKHFILSIVIFLLVVLALYFKSIFSLKIIIFSYSFSILYFIFSAQFKKNISIPKIILDIKTIINLLIFSSYGSSLSIAISNFFFRFFLIKFLTEDLASTLIICFMIGSFPVSLFSQIIGASMLRLKMNFRKVFKISFIIFIVSVSTSFLIVGELFSQENLKIFNIENSIKLTLVASFLGVYPMMIGLFRRQFFLTNSYKRQNFFYLDIIYSLAIILIIPFLYMLDNPNYFCFSFLISGCTCYFVYGFSKYLNNKKLFKILIILIPMPIFILFFNSLNSFEFSLLNSFNYPETIMNKLSFAPLPISSILLIPLLLGQLNNKENKSITIYFVALSIFSMLFVTSYTERFNFSNFINFAQFFLPMLAIICGEIIGSNSKLKNTVLKIFFKIALIVIFMQILFTLRFNTEGLNPNFILFYVYQTEQYTSLALIIIVFVNLQNLYLKNYNTKLYYKYYLVLVLILTYVYLSKNMTLYVYTTIFFITHLFLILRTLKNYLFIIPLSFIILLSVNYLNFDYSNLIIHRTEWYSLYFFEITSSIKSFLFGSNIKNELYKITPGVFNYYLDFIYNFGSISIVPLLLLISLTVTRIIKYTKINTISSENLFIIVVLAVVVFIDSFLKVSLKQPYIAIILYFLWGICLSSLATNSKNNN